MVTMKWALDNQGRPVSAWKAEAPAAAQTKEFGTHYHKAVRLTTTSRLAARRRSLRTLAALAATAVIK